MPYAVRKKEDRYQVTGPKGKVYSKGTTKQKAEAQRRLLYGVKHGWKPTGKQTESIKEQALNVIHQLLDC